MHVTLLTQRCILDDGRHVGFPSICQWRGIWYLAARTAMTHGIVPPGQITLWRSPDARTWQLVQVLSYPSGDLRDPKLTPSVEALYLICGAYLPHPAHHEHCDGLSNRSSENILQTLVSYTTDGTTWSPWVSLLRPNYWGWSLLALERCWVLAAYHHGQRGEAQSIVLWSGTTLFGLTPCPAIYDGASTEQEGDALRYRHAVPCEPVLYRIDASTLGCLVRTERALEVGVSRATSGYEEWRWHEVRGVGADTLHASTMMRTDAGWLVGARCDHPSVETTAREGAGADTERHSTTSARLYTLHGNQAEEVLHLESAGDCAYPSLCAGPEAGTYLVAWYSQHAHYKAGRFGVTLPGAGLYVATVRVR